MKNSWLIPPHPDPPKTYIYLILISQPASQPAEPEHSRRPFCSKEEEAKIVRDGGIALRRTCFIHWSKAGKFFPVLWKEMLAMQWSRLTWWHQHLTLKSSSLEMSFRSVESSFVLWKIGHVTRILGNFLLHHVTYYLVWCNKRLLKNLFFDISCFNEFYHVSWEWAKIRIR